jgi:branched-chain amino acid transport system permease protein
VAGALYAQLLGFITPSEFSLWINVIVLMMICVGGLGTLFGPVVGAVIMTCLPYVFVTMQEYTVLAQGLILFSVLRFLPAGVVGTLAKHMNKPTS